jgi:hypothetical protein
MFSTWKLDGCSGGGYENKYQRICVLLDITIIASSANSWRCLSAMRRVLGAQLLDGDIGSGLKASK